MHLTINADRLQHYLVASSVSNATRDFVLEAQVKGLGTVYLKEFDTHEQAVKFKANLDMAILEDRNLFHIYAD